MVIDKINELKMETHNLVHIVGLMQFMYFELEEQEDNFNKVLNKSIVSVEGQLEKLKKLNNELKQEE